MTTSMSSDDQFSTLLLLVERVLQGSGQGGEFNATHWLVEWLGEPLPALGGREPGQVLQEPGGLEVVYAILARMQSGTYC